MLALRPLALIDSCQYGAKRGYADSVAAVLRQVIQQVAGAVVARAASHGAPSSTANGRERSPSPCRLARGPRLDSLGLYLRGRAHGTALRFNSQAGVLPFPDGVMLEINQRKLRCPSAARSPLTTGARARLSAALPRAVRDDGRMAESMP
jgi:hypothetical protein